MKSLKELENTTLVWQSKGWLGSARHELVNGKGEVIARVKHLSFWTNDVEVDAPGNRWTFVRRGHFSGRHITIRSVGTGEQIALYQYRIAKPGILKFHDERTFTWQSANFWGSKWVWLDENEEPIVGFQERGTFKLSSDVDINPDASENRSIPLLIFLGWYLVLLNAQESR